jgi:hypothetical protein
MRRTKYQHDQLVHWCSFALAVGIILGLAVGGFFACRAAFALADRYLLVRTLGIIGMVMLFTWAVSKSRD